MLWVRAWLEVHIKGVVLVEELGETLLLTLSGEAGRFQIESFCLLLYAKRATFKRTKTMFKMLLCLQPVTLHSTFLFLLVAVPQISVPSFCSCFSASVVFSDWVTLKVTFNSFYRLHCTRWVSEKGKRKENTVFKVYLCSVTVCKNDCISCFF